MHIYTYLALGDSYTIGEGVDIQFSFPYQVVQQLREKNYSFSAPEIIAKTGWTTEELDAATKTYRFLHKYDLVTLLIGVNNQYRGGEVIEYKAQFEELLKKAIALAGKKEHVIVVSIPDYGITPFAKEKDPAKISQELDSFNSLTKALSIQYKVEYVDINPGSKEMEHDAELITSDGLHPSQKEYAKWASKVAECVASRLG